MDKEEFRGYFTQVDRGWLRDLDLETANEIAKKFDCEVEMLEVCSLYESDFPEKEIADFEAELLDLYPTKEAFWKKEWPGPLGGTGGVYLRIVNLKAGGFIVDETIVDPPGGTVTNYWRKVG